MELCHVTVTFQWIVRQVSVEKDNEKRKSQEEFEDTKGVIRIRKSKKNRQHNGQKKIKLNKMKLNSPSLQYKQFVVVSTTETILYIVYFRYMLSCFRKLVHFT